MDHESIEILNDERPLLPERSELLPLSSHGGLNYLYFIAFIYTCSSAFPNTPRLQIYEHIICENYYSRISKGQSQQWDCKAPVVQNELMFILGRQKLLALPSGE
jgi:hypothetical protein